MKNQRNRWLLSGMLIMGMWGCKVSEPEATPYESGTYVINAGNLPAKNGSISFLSRTSTTPNPDIFNATNARTLAGGVQDYAEIDGKGVILVNNTATGQDRVEIVEVGTFKSITTLQAPDVENPRRVLRAGFNKAYISCWDTTGASNIYAKSGYILVVNTASQTVIRKIPALKGVERMVVKDNEVFVGSTGSSGDNTLLVIDAYTDEIKQRIDFGTTPEPTVNCGYKPAAIWYSLTQAAALLKSGSLFRRQSAQ